MRNLLKIIIATLLCTASVTAQDLRIGERIPAIDVDSSAGDDLKLVDEEYTCLIFMHSKSEPAVEAIRQFSELILPYRNKIGIVLLTPEQDGFEEDMLQSLTSNDTLLAFDNDGRTFRNFGVSYIPFSVIYKTRARKTLWFGSLSQLGVKELSIIIK